MKKIILIGQTGSGKTTICQWLHGEEMKYKKTQAVDFFDFAIDTPGEYLENRFYYNALINTSADADYIGFIQDCTESQSVFPPTFGSIFSKPIFGIVTKIDLEEKEGQIQQAKDYLLLAGAEKVYPVSTVTGEGMQALVESLKAEENENG